MFLLRRSFMNTSRWMMRLQTTTAAGAVARQRGTRNGGAGFGARLASMPPAFDIMKPNDSDITKGYMLRMQYINQCVIINFMKQLRSTVEVGDDPKVPPRFYDGQNKIIVFLPTVFIARFLSVLEGGMPKCDVASRTSQGVFEPGSTPNSFVLSCKSMRSDGSPPAEWSCEFDPASALLLHRFLVQALHYNSGFGHSR